MAGNHKSGRKPIYMKLSEWQSWLRDEWLPFKNNEFFHLKVELRVQSFVVGIILIIITAVAVKVFGG